MLQSELFKLLEGTADAAYTTTETGEILSWNSAAEKLFGYPASEALNRVCSDLLQGRGVLGTLVCPTHCHIAAKGNPVPNFDLEVKARSGLRIWVSVSTLLFNDSRNCHHLVVHLAHDITPNKRAEDLVYQMQNISKQILAVSDGLGRHAPVNPLSESELQILRLFSQGKNSNQTARALGITLQTLRNHLHHINKKLRTHSRVEALTHAVKRKLI
jgi:PAS domain S-box-containing protein